MQNILSCFYLHHIRLNHYIIHRYPKLPLQQIHVSHKSPESKNLKNDTFKKLLERTLQSLFKLFTMEEIVLFRIFLTFPLISLLLPDIIGFSPKSSLKMQQTHIIIDVCLIICIIICQISIALNKRKNVIAYNSTH